MGSLLRLLGRRLISLPFVAFGVVFLVFFLMSFSQYDPAVSALGENATAEQLAAYRHEMGFDRSWGEQFLSYLGGLFQGNLGVYGVNKDSVSSRIATAFPITLQLTFIALIIAVVFSVIFGVLAALYRDTWVDQVIRVISIIAIATPSFWLGVLLIYLLQIKLALLPGAGELVPFSVDPGEYLARMAMPAFSLGFPVAGQMTRIIRNTPWSRTEWELCCCRHRFSAAARPSASSLRAACSQRPNSHGEYEDQPHRRHHRSSSPCPAGRNACSSIELGKRRYH